MKKALKITTFIIAILISAIIFYLLFTKNTFIDDKIYKVLAKYITNTNTSIAKIFTFLGSTLFITILCVLSLIPKKTRFSVVINTLIAVGISQALKRIIRRARPIGVALIKETGFSFPSGHSMVGFVFYGFVIYLIYKSKLSKTLKVLLITLFSLLIISIGLSRIYLGVHHATDVIGGFTLGYICLYIFIEFIYKKFFNKVIWYVIIKNERIDLTISYFEIK